MSTPDEKVQARKSGRLRKWFVRLLVAGGCLFLLGAAVLTTVLLYYSSSLPSFDSLADYHPPQVTRMMDRNGIVVAELFEEKRTVVSFERIPHHVRNAFLAAEDADFYSHPGLDLLGMLRAMWHNLKAGHVVQGGSTITQQVIKTFILGPERSYARKIKELLLALRLESNLSKDEILSLYLNQIFFGHHCYGVQEAARFYFGKDISKVTIAQAAVLASLPKSPAIYSPLKHPERALERRNWVLSQMHQNNMISAEQEKQAIGEEMEIAAEKTDFFEHAPYYAEHCRRLLEEKLGREKLYQGGLRVDLAVDADMQVAAQEAVATGLRSVDRRHGFRGPMGKLTPEQIRTLHERHDSRTGEAEIWSVSPPQKSEDGKQAGKERIHVRWKKFTKDALVVVPVVSMQGEGKDVRVEVDLGPFRANLDPGSIKWARKFSPLARTPSPVSASEIVSLGDLVEIRVEDPDPEKPLVHLSQPPLVQGALVALDPETKHVLAMVGGSDFRQTPLIRAVQSRRQPGSAFKPILYAAAIHTGAYSPATILMDTPEVYRSSLRGSAWKPQNFEREFTGAVNLRHALAHSINTVAVKMGSEVGPANIIQMAKDLGIQSELTSNLSLALGASEVTPLELTNAYGVFAGHGLAGDPVFITRVTAPDGEEIVVTDPPEIRQAISEAEAFVMTSLLRSVVEDGTGRKALALGRPLAGKTGTANQQRDGWFVGFSPDLATGVWVGFDDHKSMGYGWAQGAGTALPIWVAFMKEALESRPKLDFKAPDGVVFARVDPENGLLASPRLAGAKFEVFVEGTEPRSVSSRVPPEEAARLSNGQSLVSPANGGKLPEGFYR